MGRVLAMGLERFSKGKLKALTTMQSSAGARRPTREDSRLDEGFAEFCPSSRSRAAADAVRVQTRRQTRPRLRAVEAHFPLPAGPP
jgi:hypothetical protein